ncbi:hypothetical protein J6590_065590 [Homalodisca vitripennis]|nr:hypothetical protein J6590_065590 [Homalodisca vitripennis]
MDFSTNREIRQFWTHPTSVHGVTGFAYLSPKSQASLRSSDPYPSPTLKIHDPVRMASISSGFVGGSRNYSALSTCFSPQAVTGLKRIHNHR